MKRLSLIILVSILMSTASSWALELTCKGKADFDSYTIRLSFTDSGQPDLWGKVTVIRGKDILLKDDNAVMGEFKTVQIRGILSDTGEQAFIILRLDPDLKTGEAVLSSGRSGVQKPFGSYTCETWQVLSGPS
jgi:hypothetical protein